MKLGKERRITLGRRSRRKVSRWSQLLFDPSPTGAARLRPCAALLACGSDRKLRSGGDAQPNDTKSLLLPVTLFLLCLRAHLLDERWVVPRADASLLPGVFMSSAHFSAARQAAHSPPVAVAPGARLKVLAVERLLGMTNLTERRSNTNTVVMNTLACGTSLSKLGMVSRARSVLVF